MEVTVIKNRMARLATGVATAALLATALAVPATAAVPAATSGGSTYGQFGGDGYAGFSLDYTLTDTSTLAKLFLEVDISGAASVKLFSVTLNGSSVKGCQQPTAAGFTCDFKTVRTNDTFHIDLALQPLAGADVVALSGGWSSSGYVTGGNNSHGDAWDLCQIGQDGCIDGDPNDPAMLNVLTSTRNSSVDAAAGFGNKTLSTASDFGTNNQAATLLNLPAGKYASVNDNFAPDASGFPIIELTVNNGALATFQLQIFYPKGTKAPSSYIHTSDNYPTETYYECQKGSPKVSCFTWEQKSNTAVLYLLHNGGVRRS
jgi:hypothetical protein